MNQLMPFSLPCHITQGRLGAIKLLIQSSSYGISKTYHDQSMVGMNKTQDGFGDCRALHPPSLASADLQLPRDGGTGRT